jgi:hypothetical protein
MAEQRLPSGVLPDDVATGGWPPTGGSWLPINDIARFAVSWATHHRPHRGYTKPRASKIAGWLVALSPSAVVTAAGSRNKR